MLKKIDVNISGIHCKSCKTLIETEIDILDGVNSVSVDHQSGEASIEFDDEKVKEEKIFKEIEKLNYKVKKSHEHTMACSSKKTKNILLFLALVALILGYFLVGRLGGFEMLGELSEGNVGYGMIFMIGLLSGFHCVGMCGGLVVAYSANCLINKENIKNATAPHFQYNIGRVISYTMIGGILGGVGSFFGINPTFTGILVLFASVFMILMGISFLGNLKILEKIKLRTPAFIAKFLYNQKYSKNPKGPFVVGLLTGFMPCGPLQAVQLYALASGSILTGALSMSIYAVGTAILLFGFGISISKIGESYIGRIIKVSGILLILLGMIMANRGLANFGYGLNNVKVEKRMVFESSKEFQVVEMELSYLGYKPNVLYIKKDIPVKWVINVKEMTGCTNAIMIESLGIKRDLKIGENIIVFTPPKDVEEIKFSCWMRMVWGKFVVTDGNKIITPKDLEIFTPSTGASCSGGCGKSTCGASSGRSCGCGAK